MDIGRSKAPFLVPLINVTRVTPAHQLVAQLDHGKKAVLSARGPVPTLPQVATFQIVLLAHTVVRVENIRAQKVSIVRTASLKLKSALLVLITRHLVELRSQAVQIVTLDMPVQLKASLLPWLNVAKATFVHLRPHRRLRAHSARTIILPRKLAQLFHQIQLLRAALTVVLTTLLRLIVTMYLVTKVSAQ